MIAFLVEQSLEAVTRDGEHISLLLNAGLELNTEHDNKPSATVLGFIVQKLGLCKKASFLPNLIKKLGTAKY